MSKPIDWEDGFSLTHPDYKSTDSYLKSKGFVELGSNERSNFFYNNKTKLYVSSSKKAPGRWTVLKNLELVDPSTFSARFKNVYTQGSGAQIAYYSPIAKERSPFRPLLPSETEVRVYSNTGKSVDIMPEGNKKKIPEAILNSVVGWEAGAIKDSFRLFTTKRFSPKGLDVMKKLFRMTAAELIGTAEDTQVTRGLVYVYGFDGAAYFDWVK